MTEDDDILAAELALGLLNSGEQGAAERRADTDAAFALAVDRWRTVLVGGIAEMPPPAHVWTGIDRRLSANDNDAGVVTALARWRAAAIGASAVAAALAIALVTRPPETVERIVERTVEVPVAQPPVLAAALTGDGSPDAVAINIEPGAGLIVITPLRISDEGGVPQLWVIPADGRPRSLGLVEGDAPESISIANDLRVYLRDGSTLAISIEPSGGSPTGQPNGPITATGEIRPI